MKIIYRRNPTTGEATDCRYEPDAYVLLQDEHVMAEDAIPKNIDALHLEPYISQRAVALQLAREEQDVNKAILKALFFIVNEIRGLKSQAPLTRAQFLTWVRGL